jgi:hypothetical protein
LPRVKINALFIDRLVENELSLVSSLENENQEVGERVCEVHPTHAVSPKSESAANQAYPRDAATSFCTTSADGELLIKLGAHIA